MTTDKPDEGATMSLVDLDRWFEDTIKGHDRMMKEWQKSRLARGYEIRKVK
ncbi:MAG: hypothetical protein ACRCUC_02270 [Aestuariivirga sp.]